MYWKIKCKNKKHYDFVKETLEDQGIPFKQKEENKPIKIKGSDVEFADTIYMPLVDNKSRFTLYSIDYKGATPSKVYTTYKEKDKDYER